ncbi:MAG: hypothetical protein A7315_09070 [Candidatus Altiarchaeales archaeon WOR_SM1_79]|nr:MAG: hypothetical protein A7315_09070 [Candidatus Altiarchaeales archaeon WOR_SM1_79]
MKRLLILSCSNTKKKSKDLLPAIERYDGINYRVIKKLQREGNFPDELDIGIISAKYGFLTPDIPIEYYDQKMTRKRALELQPEVSSELNEFLQNNGYSKIFVNLGKEYRLLLNGFDNAVSADYAEGSIGQKASQMKKWILSLNSK